MTNDHDSEYLNNERTNANELAQAEINEFLQGNKSFEDVADYYGQQYAGFVQSNKAWSWTKNVVGGVALTRAQQNIIKQNAENQGLIPKINIKKVAGLRYGVADFMSAGLVVVQKMLHHNLWTASSIVQNQWLNEQIGGEVEGYTWHHSEVPGEMHLVPFGMHNATTHNGGRTVGQWSFRNNKGRNALE